MAGSRTRRARTVALTASLLLAGGVYGATSAQALDGCSAVSGASACWSGSRDAFTVRDTAVDGATVRVEYRVDLGTEDVVGRCATRADGLVTQTCAVNGLPEGKAVVWSVSTWQGAQLVQRGPTQYHTS